MAKFRPHVLSLLFLSGSLALEATAAEPPAEPPALAAEPAGPRALRQRPITTVAEGQPVDSESGPPVLFGKKVQVGGYGSMNVAYTRMFGEDGALLGLEGAILLDHRLSLGIAGFAWTNPQQGPDDWRGNERRYQTGYFGGAFRYSFLSQAPVYLTAGAVVGSGAVVLVQEHHDDDSDDVDVEREDVDVFAVFQPEVSLQANLTRWLRLGVTAGYRLTAGVGGLGHDEADVNGLVAGGHLQFGRF